MIAHCSFAAAEETVAGQICGVVEMPANADGTTIVEPIRRVIVE